MITIDLAEAWLPLTYAVNALNRSMGAEDLYPFVLSPAVAGKLAFVRGAVAGGAVADPLGLALVA